jgi:NAD-dependent DNA ligase
MKRGDAQKWVVERGGLAGSDVTAETTVLVVGGDELEAATPSSKLKKARKQIEKGGSIEILGEPEFFSRFGGAQ